MVRIAEFDVETGEFTLGERCWKDRASSVVDVGEGDDTHLAHEVLRNAIVLAKRERDRLLQLNPTSAVERVNKNERLKVLAPLIQIVRKAGRPKNP